MDVVRRLAGEIGPRRPASGGERRAGEEIARCLTSEGAEVRQEPFRGYSSFGPLYVLLSVALAVAADRQRRVGRDRAGWSATALWFAATATALAEGGLRWGPVSHLLARRDSQNLVATAPAEEAPEGRLVLVGHLDSSRSGLIFHPRLWRVPKIATAALAAAAGTVAAGPILRRNRAGRAVLGGASAFLGAAACLLAEREMLGEDVCGANDNASGSAVATALFMECLREPCRHLDVELLLTGCEESGLLGMQAYLRRHCARRGPGEVEPTWFLNFDSVGGPAPLRYLVREGIPPGWPADPLLVSRIERIARSRPDLGLRPARGAAGGLPTDATAALARGLPALTLIAQSDRIPNYHWPTDTVDRIDARAIGRALDAGRAFVREMDADLSDARAPNVRDLVTPQRP